MKIVHITSAHPSLDIRIFYKECLALAEAGHCVHLVAPQSSVETYRGIKIHALNDKKQLSRWPRLFQIYKLAKRIPADVYHFHDPEFIPFALLLKSKKNKVIYDVHEDTPRESYSFNKHTPLKAIFKSIRWMILEKIGKLYFDGFVCATSHIAKNFPPKKTVTICNYVNIDEFSNSDFTPFENRTNTVIYVGGIMKTRGVEEMVSALNLLPQDYQAKLKLIGLFSPPNLEEEVKKLTGWNQISALGWLSREKLLSHFYDAKVGLVLLHPERNFKEALPIKLFEYMAASLPVIVSDFPLWREIVLNAGCGFVVDPFDTDAICQKIQFFFDNPSEAEKMGRAGHKAASQFYNWQAESKRLISFYQKYSKSECHD